MSKIYTTSDYFRDNLWFIDYIFNFVAKVKTNRKKFFRNLTDNDFESHVFRILENIPYGIAILFLGFMLVIALLRATETKNGIVVTSIYTNSMVPHIMPGSLVFTIPKKSYRMSDVVTYKERSSKNGEYTGRVLMHRIVEVKINPDNTKTFVTKGDNNANPDASNVSPSDILGNTRLIIPYFGYIDFLSKTIPGFLIFIMTPSVLLILEARRYLKQKDF